MAGPLTGISISGDRIVDETWSRRIPYDHAGAGIAIKSICSKHAGGFAKALDRRRCGVGNFVVGDFDIGIVQLNTDRQIVLLLAGDPESLESTAANIIRLDGDTARANDRLASAIR